MTASAGDDCSRHEEPSEGRSAPPVGLEYTIVAVTCFIL